MQQLLQYLNKFPVCGYLIDKKCHDIYNLYMKKIIVLILCIFIPLSLVCCDYARYGTPELTIDGDTLSWTAISDAESYSLKIMFDDVNGYELTTTETSYRAKFVKKGSYAFAVRANINGKYTKYSNEVNYTLDKDINISSSADGSVTYRGSGTADDPILIESATQLLSIQTGTKKVTTNGISETIQLYYKQTCDIDLSGNNTDPICTGSKKFSGYYDGNGYKITNITQNKVPDSGYIYMGLFGSIENASIINVTIENYSANMSYVSKNFGWGAIAGYSKQSNIENCHVTGIISINSPINAVYYGYAGMLIGESQGSSIRRCSASGEINMVFSKCYVGGIAGTTNIGTKDTIKNCLSTVKITTHSTGRNSGVPETSSYAGGLIGYATSFSEVSNSVADAYLSATAIDGGDPLTIGKGIFGGGKFRQADGLSSLEYTNCYFNYQKLGLELSEEYPTIEALVDKYAIGGKTNKQNSKTTVFGFDDSQASLKETYKDFDFTDIWEIKDGKLALRSYRAEHTI